MRAVREALFAHAASGINVVNCHPGAHGELGARQEEGGVDSTDTPKCTLSEVLPATALLKEAVVSHWNDSQSLGGLLGNCSAGALHGTSAVAEELGVDALEGSVPLALGLLDAVAVGLLVLVVVRMVLRLSHPFSIYDADYIK